MKKEKIEVRVSAVEKSVIKSAAENKDLTVADYIRELIFEDLKKSGLIGKSK